MARRVIVLDRPHAGRWNVAYWLTVPTARQGFYAQAGATSAWKDASAPELADLQSGVVREVVETYSVETTPTLSEVQAALEARWQALQDETDVYNPWLRYGSSWDGTAWTLSGVS
jgi:hypothetical protein